MGFATQVGRPLSLRLSAPERALLIGPPESLVAPSGAGPRFFLEREWALWAMNARRLAVLVVGHAPDGLLVEAVVGGAPLAAGDKGARFAVDAPGGEVALGMPGAEQALLAVPPGPLTLEARRDARGLRLRLVPRARGAGRLVEVPDLSPSPRRWDRHVTRPVAVERLLARAEVLQAESQRRLEERLPAHDRYALDQEAADLALAEGDEERFRGLVHAIATEGNRGGFRWAWANPSIVPSLRARSYRVRELGLREEIDWLVEEELGVPAADVRRLVALATITMGCQGSYPVPYERGVLWVALDAPPAHAAA